MPEENDKKIKFKILTAEELLNEELSQTKEIKYEEEKINIPLTEKIESKKTSPSFQKIQEKKDLLKNQIESGLIYYKEEKSKEIFSPEIKTFKEVITPKVESASLPEKLVETKPIEKKEEIKNSTVEEIFYKPIIKENELIKPRKEILKEDLQEEKQKEVLKNSYSLSKYIKYTLIGVGLIMMIGLIIFLKPYEKLKLFLTKERLKEENKTETQIQIIQTQNFQTSTIIFPTLITTSTEIATQSITTSETYTSTDFSFTTETTVFKETTTQTEQLSEITTSKESNVSKETSTLTENVNQIATSSLSETGSLPEDSYPRFLVSGEIQFLKNFNFQEIRIQELNAQTFKKEFDNFLTKQEEAGNKVYLKFFHGSGLVSLDLIFDYFIKPTKISTTTIESFKNELVGNYGLLIYYGYTRKYPLLIFEIKDKEKVEKFNQQWEKLSMKDDLQILFLGNLPPKTKNTFVTKKINNFAYRILDFGNNYKIIWAVIDKYLIYSSTETGIKEIINYIK